MDIKIILPPEPAVCAFKVVRTGAQLKDFIQRNKVSDLQVYYNRPGELESLRYTEFLQQYNTLSQLLKIIMRIIPIRLTM